MTISEQIIQVIDNLCTKFGVAINWTSENVIPYLEILCKKLITYEIATSAMWILVMWTLFCVSVFILKKTHPWLIKKANESFDEEYEIVVVALWAITIILGIVTVCVTCDQAIDIIKCFTFPEMYVFEYVSALMK